MKQAPPSSQLRLRAHRLDLASEARVMGILNVTPDSFYDEGRFGEHTAALNRAWHIAEEGAAILDLGGRSYAHWNAPVDADEEIRRVIPLVALLVREGYPLPLSIDTTRARVADAALAAGASMINDCSGLADPELAGVVARYDAALVVMHLKGRLNMRSPQDYRYDDVVAEITAFLGARIETARAAGVAHNAIVADPGLEFGKEPRTDLEIIDRFAEFGDLEVPLVLAASRKSFIGRIFGRPASALLASSLALAAAAIVRGARIVRAHDVRETVDVCRMLAAIRPERRATIPLAREMPR